MPGTTAFPAALDAHTDVGASSSELLRSHSGEHNNHIAALLAVETKVGIDGSEDPASFDFRIAAIEDFLNELAIADVAGLQDALDGKAATSHTHAAGDITSGVLAAARLASGSPIAGYAPVYQEGGSVQWAAVSGGGGGSGISWGDFSGGTLADIPDDLISGGTLASVPADTYAAEAL